MDRNYYFDKMAKEREHEISQLWAHPRIEPHTPVSRKRARRIAWRVALALIFISGIIYFI